MENTNFAKVGIEPARQAHVQPYLNLFLSSTLEFGLKLPACVGLFLLISSRSPHESLP